MKGDQWQPRVALEEDQTAIQSLLEASVRKLQTDVYSAAQIEAALGPVYAVDHQLIKDGTYFVVESGGNLIGCGGWSRRKTLYGAGLAQVQPDHLLDPTQDSAKVRAFFVHPHWARQGVGSAIMQVCERHIRLAGFKSAEMIATLTGEPLYGSFGYEAGERYPISLPNGLELPVVRMTKTLDFVV